jgi:hypothetical protein
VLSSARPFRAVFTRSGAQGPRKSHLAGALTGAVVAGAALVGAPMVTTTAGAAEAPAAKIAPARFDQPAWAAEWMTGKSKYTEATAVEAARRYDVIAAQGNTFKAFAPAMRRANPDLKILAYVNGPFAARWAPTYAENMYAHNAAGNRVRATTFGNDLMNAYMPEWKREVVRLCKDELARSGYDGCFLDSLGNGIFDGTYLNSKPIDPRTGQVYDKVQWIKDTGALAQYVRDNTDVPVATNGLGNGTRWFSGSVPHHLGDGSDLSMAELWLRGPHASASAFPTAKNWKQNVDMLTASEARGTGVLTVTKMWGDDNTPKLVDQWYEYTLGSFLLGANGKSRMFFLADGCTPHVCGTGASDLAHQPAPDLAIGNPTGAYTATGNGIHTRSYDAGYVAVNPEKTDLKLTLPAGTWTNLHGAPVSGTVTIPATSGLVLTKTGASQPAPDPEPAPEPEPTPEPTPEPEPAPEPAPAGPTCEGLQPTIVGTSGKDRIRGTAGADVIHALGGDDVIEGLGGDDVICGGGGNDTVYGNGGADLLVGAAGADNMVGAVGDDDLLGGDGTDKLSGGNGKDACVGGQGKNTLRWCELTARR